MQCENIKNNRTHDKNLLLSYDVGGVFILRKFDFHCNLDDDFIAINYGATMILFGADKMGRIQEFQIIHTNKFHSFLIFTIIKRQFLRELHIL